MQFRRSFRALALYFCAVLAALAADFRPGVVLVKFHPDATADDIAELQSRKGLRLTKHIRLFGIYAYAYDDAKAGPAEFAAELAKEPIVQTAEPDFVRELKAVDPEYPNQWSLHNTGQVVNGKSGPAGIDIRWPEANLVYKPKSPLIVGVIDSGVTLLHPDLVASIHAKTSESANGFNGIDEDGNGLIDDLWGYDWYDLDPLPLDQNGHGTLVASIIAGTIGNGEGIAGITNSVKIRGYRVFNQFGRSGQPKFKSGGYAVSDVMASLATAVDDGCKVINLSLGGGAYSVLEAGVFEEIATMQVLCVISSGNDGKNNDQTPTYPASYPAASIIAVAAQDRTGGLASFSNYGVQTTDLAAPGTDIRGADVTRRVIYSNDFSSGANGWAPFRYTNSDYSFASWTISGGYLVDRTYGSYYSPWTDTYARSPLIDARNYSGVRVQYDGIFDVANDLLSADLSFDGLNWDSFRQYTGTGSGVDQFDASDMDFSRFYLRFRLSSGGSYQGIGVGVRSVTVSAINDLDTTNPSYQFSSGTSFSAPIVSGVVCMVWTHQPSLTAVQVKEIILKSVRKVPALDGKVLTGGMVDAEAALKLADVYAGNVLPAVSVPPRGGFFLQGDAVTLSVVATPGLPVTYQWRKNGVNIAGERGSTFSLGSLALTDAGLYDVVVTSQAGSVTSASAQVTVSARLPSIVTQPTLPAAVMVAGEAYQLSCAAAGTPPFTYQWMKNGVAISGATSASLSIARLASTDAGAYTVKVINAAGSVVSSSVSVTVVQRPAFTTDLPTAPVSLLAGTSKVLSVVATGTPAPTYQWRKNGAPIAGAIGPSYVALAGTAEGTTTYDVVITNTAGTATSATATIATCLPAAVTAAPVARSVVSGQAASFTVTAGGTGPFTYQWMKNGVAIAGATSATYDIAAVSGAQAGLYSVKVTGPVGAATSPGATLSVLGFATDLPTAPVSLLAGTSKVLSVVATGTPAPTYQWRKNGSPVAGAIGPSYVALAGTIEGASTYDVVITNSAGTLTSAATTITTCLPAAVAAAPVARNVVAGQPTSFTVTAGGTGPFTYQWMRNGVAIAGATSATYDIATVTAAQAGLYSVKVAGPASSATSVGATLSVLGFITDLPTAPVGLLGGASKVLSVVATGTPAPTYQWLKNGSPIAGAIGPSYVALAGTVEGTSTYDVVITNTAGTATSAAATIATCLPAAVTTSPVARNVVAGQPTSFSVSVSGTGPFTYQWMLNGVAIAGATSATYDLAAASAAQAGLYSVKVTGPANTVTSAGAALSVLSPFVFTTQPLGALTTTSIATGLPKVLSVAVSGTGPFTYQWRKDGVAIAGATLATYSIPAQSSEGSAVYDVVVSGPVSTSSSNPVRVDACVPVSVTQNPVSIARAVGQPAGFAVTAGGTGPFTYQWLKNGVAIVGATAATYAIDSVQTTSAASYSVKITGPVGSVTSAAASLVLHTAPSIVTQPASLYKGAGQSATFSVTATGTGPFTYQWSKDGNPIAGANAASLAFAAVAAQDAGRYSVSVSNDVGAVLSQEGELTVVALPTIVTPPTPVNVVDAKVTRSYRAIYFGFNNSPDGWATVPWSGKDGEWPSSGWYWSDQINEGLKASNIECANGGGELVSPAISLAGLTSPELRFWHARAGTAFAVLVSTDKVNWTPLFSETASQSLGNDIIVSLGAYAGQTCYLKFVSDGPALVDEVAVWGTGLAKEMLELSVYAAGQGMSYQWYKDGVAIAGATLRGLVLADANAATAAGSYSVKVTNAAGSVTSSAAYVGLSPSIATQPTSASKLNGQAASFSVVAAGTAPFTYQWYRDGTPISGATNATCSIASASTQTAGNYYVVVANSVGQVTSQTVALGVTLPPTLTSQPQSATVVRKLSQGTLAKFDFDSGEQGWVFGAMPDDLSSIPWFFGWDDPTQLNGLVECDNYSGRYGHQYARSPWISLVGASNVQLAFSANTYIAGAGSLNLTVEASPDGVNWTVLKSNCPSFNDPGYQSSYSVSLAAFAGKGCYLRARLQGANGSSGVIDDFIVTGYGYPAANVAFSATAVSTVPCTYQWYRNGVAIAGATASTYTPPDPYASTATGAYTVVVTNAAGSVTSSAASLTQVDPPAITSQPAAQVVTGSYLSPLTAANYTFDTGASGWVYGAYSDNQSPYHWDWDASTSSVTDRMFGTAYASYTDSYTQSPWINLSTSIGSTLTFNSAWSLYPDALDTFFVQASSNGTNWTTLKAYTGSGSGSTTVSLSAYDLYGCYLRFGLYSSPLYNGYGINVYDARVSGSTLIPGAPATFSVAAASSTACTYQWFKDGAPITGASASTYSIPYTYSSDAGYYSVRVTNAAGSVSSTSARLSFK